MERFSEPGFFNLNHGAEVQLRGLGVGTTLTLVNGQRQGASGYQGTFTDVSTIPVSAIERIEILPEGTAALYGSDAIGGVVNIILRRNFEGIEARVRASATDSDVTERSAALLAGHAGARGNVSRASSSTTAMLCGAVHARIVPPTLTSGVSAALIYAASPAIPAPSSTRSTLDPLPPSRTGRTERTNRRAAHPWNCQLHGQRHRQRHSAQADHAQRVCECLVQGDATMGDSG